MKHTKKWMTLAGLAVLAVFPACSGGENAGENADKQAAKTAAPSPSEQAKPAEIKYFVSDSNFVQPDAPLSQQSYVKYVEEKTNTKLNIEVISHGKYEETLRLKFASSDTPDVFLGFTLNFAGAQNRILPLNELIDKYGPNLKKAIPREAWDAVTVNGQIVAIPNVLLTSNNSAFYIRKDWLDKVGMAAPKTSDELLEVLRAFRDKDPNGNGQKDEIPFSMREKFTWWDPIKGMWGVASDYVEHEGQIIPSIIHPNMKQVLGYLKTMYDEKLVDQEFLSNTGPVQEKKLLSDMVGSFNHQTLSAASWNLKITSSLKDKNPVIINVPTPRGKGYDGPLGGLISPSGRYWFIMKTAKNPEAIIRMFDWLATEEGSIFAEFGLEGETFVREGEKIVYDSEKSRALKMDMRAGLFRGVGQGLDPEAKMKRNQEEEKRFQLKQEAIAVSKQEGVQNVMNGLPEPETLKRFPDLKPDTGTLFQEAAAKIIMGKEPIDYFDTFVKEYRKQGGDDLIKELTNSYNSHHGK